YSGPRPEAYRSAGRCNKSTCMRYCSTTLIECSRGCSVIARDAHGARGDDWSRRGQSRVHHDVARLAAYVEPTVGNRRRAAVAVAKRRVIPRIGMADVLYGYRSGTSWRLLPAAVGSGIDVTPAGD